MHGRAKTPHRQRVLNVKRYHLHRRARHHPAIDPIVKSLIPACGGRGQAPQTNAGRRIIAGQCVYARARPPIPLDHRRFCFVVTVYGSWHKLNGAHFSPPPGLSPDGQLANYKADRRLPTQGTAAGARAIAGPPAPTSATRAATQSPLNNRAPSAKSAHV